jgi:lipopolysaccharide export system protein LptA
MSREWLPRALSLLALFPIAWCVGAPAALALPQDAEQPIHIRADAAEMDQASDQIIYQGAVRVDQGTLRVDADRITVQYENQKVVRIVAEGGPASYRQEVENPAGEVVAQANTIVYLTRDERLELRGSASLSQLGNEISGEKILYDMVAGKVEAVSGEGGSVRMVLQPASRPR